MREQNKFNKLVQNTERVRRQNILDTLERDFPQYSSNAAPEDKSFTQEGPRSSKKMSVGAKVMLSSAVVGCCLFIGLATFFIKLLFTRYGSDDPGYTPPENNVITEYDKVEGETIKEYNAKLTDKIAYFDWYEYMQTESTFMYKQKDGKEIYGIEEIAIDPQTGEKIGLRVTRQKYNLDIDDRIISGKKNSVIIDGGRYNTKFFYTTTQPDISGYFNDGYYRYVITLYESSDGYRLVQLAQDLIKKSQENN